MNIPHDARTTRQDIDREITEILGLNTAADLRRASDRVGHERMVEQATKNLSVHVVTSIERRRIAPRAFRLRWVVSTVAAAAVVVYVMFLPSSQPSTTVETSTQPLARIEESASVIAPASQVIMPSAEVSATQKRTPKVHSAIQTLDESLNMHTQQALTDIYSADVVDRLATVSAETTAIASITDSDIDQLLRGI